MIRYLLGFLLALTLALPQVSLARAQVAYPATATVSAATDLRSGPGSDYAVVGTAAPGQAVVLLAANAGGTWYRLDRGVWIAAAAVSITGAAGAEATGNAIPPGAEVATVTAITDGDTITVALEGVETRLRYIGIDTPERGQPGYKAATTANRQLVLGKTVYLVADRSEVDRYDRLLRYLFLADGTFVNGQLVAQGWAQPVAYPPDTARQAELEQLAVAAARAQRGFWSGTAPYDGAMSYALTTAPAPLYDAPGGDTVTATLPADTPLTVFGRTVKGDWFQVRTPVRAGGWVAAAAVRINVPFTQIPVTGKAAAAPAAAPATPAIAIPAATPAAATVNARANLRTGPGTTYPVAGSVAPGTRVTVVGRSADGGWLKLASGQWIAAFLVDGAPGDLPVVGAAPRRVASRLRAFA